jgi:hypothetical protein
MPGDDLDESGLHFLQGPDVHLIAFSDELGDGVYAAGSQNIRGHMRVVAGTQVGPGQHVPAGNGEMHLIPLSTGDEQYLI